MSNNPTYADSLRAEAALAFMDKKLTGMQRLAAGKWLIARADELEAGK